MGSNVAVLLVSPLEADHAAFRRIFDHTKWVLYAARTRGEAIRFLEETMVPVVVSEEKLPDGNWHDLCESLRALPSPPLLIVTAESSDATLWATVLNLGGYDFLPKPFNRAEVIRILSLAWLEWRERARRRPRGETHGRNRAATA